MTVCDIAAANSPNGTVYSESTTPQTGLAGIVVTLGLDTLAGLKKCFLGDPGTPVDIERGDDTYLVSSPTTDQPIPTAGTYVVVSRQGGPAEGRLFQTWEGAVAHCAVIGQMHPNGIEFTAPATDHHISFTASGPLGVTHVTATKI